jgi:hypothetical protein
MSISVSEGTLLIAGSAGSEAAVAGETDTDGEVAFTVDTGGFCTDCGGEATVYLGKEERQQLIEWLQAIDAVE